MIVFGQRQAQADKERTVSVFEFSFVVHFEDISILRLAAAIFRGRENFDAKDIVVSRAGQTCE
jgi:hypothetical protein